MQASPMPVPSEGFFASTRTFQLKHKTEFRSETDEALRLTVRQEVKAKMGLATLGISTLVFDFEPAGSTTATSSPTANNSGRSDAFQKAPPHGTAAAAAAAAETSGEAAVKVVGGEAAGGGGVAKEGGGDSERVAGMGVGGAVEAAVEREGGGDAQRTAGASSNSVVLVHNRYNGAKQLYVNQSLVYSVKKECTDGNMNSWVIPMPFGRLVLTLTSKLISHSGFVYRLTLGDSVVLFKSTS